MAVREGRVGVYRHRNLLALKAKEHIGAVAVASVDSMYGNFVHLVYCVHFHGGV
jgi:hypothetical protein